MKPKFTSIMAVLVTVTLIGSIGATTLLLQQASAVVVIGGKDFKKLSKQFQRDVLSIVPTPGPDDSRQLAKLFEDYQQATFRIFGLTPP
jgi:hypothetical protein